VTITEVCDHAYDVVRRLMSELRPSTLDSLGLAASLERLVEDWRLRHDSTTITLTVDDALGALPDDAAIKVFRVVQECLTNISRHAQATRAAVCLRRDESHGWILLEVHDDGRGFDASRSQGGLGLLGIRERVASLDGEIAILSAPGGGTRVRVTFPPPAVAPAAQDGAAPLPPVDDDGRSAAAASQARGATAANGLSPS
jgi:two-component system sensor histidine kinase UhpB